MNPFAGQASGLPRNCLLPRGDQVGCDFEPHNEPQATSAPRRVLTRQLGWSISFLGLYEVIPQARFSRADSEASFGAPGEQAVQ